MLSLGWVPVCFKVMVNSLQALLTWISLVLNCIASLASTVVAQLPAAASAGAASDAGAASAGAVVSATVVEADAKGAKVELAGGVEGYIRAADLTNEVAAGDVVEAKYTGVDRKARIVHLSVKAKDQAEEAAAVANVNNKQEDVAIPNAMAEAFKAAKGE